MSPDLTLLVAFTAGVISFLSPCVLPLVPAYLGQLTVVAVQGRAAGDPSRWLAVRHAIAYVVGFGLVFTILGITATFIGGPLADYMPFLRRAGGVVLIVMGLSLAGVLRIGILQRTWRPLDAGASASLASTTGATALVGPGGTDGMGHRIGGGLVRSRGGWLASFGLGVVFAIGWTPCIGVILGSVLTLAATSGHALDGALLLLAYTAGLGMPFIALGLVYDRAPRIVRPLVRHGREVSFVGGMLVVAIGVAMLFDWFSYLSRFTPFFSAG
jgi:cytochrome c-type biogenesis protein